MMNTRLQTCLVAALSLAACNGERGAADGVGSTSLDDGGDSTGDPDADSDGISFDVGDGEDSGPGDESDGGCAKVDFLFVVDNSGSMEDEQATLVDQFPAFMAAIADLGLKDYHVMVVDTDGPGTCSDDPECLALQELGISCPDAGIPAEAMYPCGADPNLVDQRDECDLLRGAGVTFPLGENATNERCQFATGKRWFDHNEPDPTAAFACAAQVGNSGSGAEEIMPAILETVSPWMTQSGSCNEGFLRDDAILVVTVITDEWFTGSLRGELTDEAIQPYIDWFKPRLLAAKDDNEDAVVLFVVFNDTPSVHYASEEYICRTTYGSNAPTCHNSIAVIESFKYGGWGSICEEDFASLFSDAIQIIDDSCDSFVPPG